MRTAAFAMTAALLLAPGCRKAPVIEKVPEASYTPPSLTSTPSPTVTKTQALRVGKPSPSCVYGWREPSRYSGLRTFPLDLLRKSQGFDKEFHVVDLRYFTGPDDANKAPRENRIERWYGQVVYTGKPEFLIRFLAVRRSVGSGIVAIADYGTSGFASPDWYGFDGEGGKSTYPGLPGTWPGQPYDYVKAGELPPEVRGCLTPQA